MLTPEAKNLLSSTIRNLRERLIIDLYNAVDSAYRLSISSSQGVYYLVASQLDNNPFLLFELRGLSKEELQNKLRCKCNFAKKKSVNPAKPATCNYEKTESKYVDFCCNNTYSDMIIKRICLHSDPTSITFAQK